VVVLVNLRVVHVLDLIRLSLAVLAVISTLDRR
jgi:hypothetical protein